MTSDPDKTPADSTIIDLDPDTVVEDRPPPGSSTPPRRARNATGWVAGAAALAIAAIAGGWVYRDFLSPYLPTDQMAQAAARTEALETGVGAVREQLQSLDRLAGQLKTDVDALENSMGAAAADAKAATATASSLSARADKIDAAITALKASQDELSRQLTTLQTAPQPSTGNNAPAAVDLSAITQRLANLEKDVASLKAAKTDAVDTAALSQALSDLKAKHGAGAGYVEELSRLQRMVPAAPGLDVLAASATSGVPTAAALAEQLKAAAPGLAPQPGNAQAAEDNGWWAWMSDLVSDVITIRNAGDTDWQRVAEAAAAFAESGDLAQAMSHIESAEGARPVVLQQWLDAARQRMAADAALADVDAAVLRMIAARG